MDAQEVMYLVPEILGRGLVFFMCFMMAKYPPVGPRTSDTRPTQPYQRPIEYMSMGDSILYHLPRKQ
jgi:hypothetical protein